MLNTRSNEKEEFTWQQFLEEMISIFNKKAGVTEWEEIYGEPFTEPEQEKEPEKEEVAPVQPINEEEKGENVDFTECETVLGQEAAAVEENKEKREEEKGENVDFTVCETVLEEESKTAAVQEERLREKAAETAYMIGDDLTGWTRVEEMTIEKIWKCIENAEKLLEMIKKLEEQKAIEGGEECQNTQSY